MVTNFETNKDRTKTISMVDKEIKKTPIYVCTEVFFYCKLETLALASFWIHSIFFSFAWLGNLLI